jgi:hypothetical protein
MGLLALLNMQMAISQLISKAETVSFAAQEALNIAEKITVLASDRDDEVTEHHFKHRFISERGGNTIRVIWKSPQGQYELPCEEKAGYQCLSLRALDLSRN